MAELVFFSGTMDCGKSTLALQTDHNHAARGRAGIVFTSLDRAGEETLSSRLGLKVPAVEVTPETDFWVHVVEVLESGGRCDYLICDEAQFYSGEQVDQLSRIVDELGVDVFAFGILTDFRTKLFPGSQRLVELADKVQVLQVEALCWCGARATHNARTVNGDMVIEGEQVMVGDTFSVDVIGYEVLCRRHYGRRMTATSSHAAHMSPTPLPFADADTSPHSAPSLVQPTSAAVGG